MGVFTNIQAALNTRLDTLSGLPDVHWPNTKYQPIENRTFLRPTILPAETILDTLNGMQEHKGIYQVDIFVPLEKGINVLNDFLDDIEDLFSSNKTLTATDTVFIQAVSRGIAQRQEAWYVSYVAINYICYS